MYTQCSHCKAVFRVTMKELTAAQGLLRCGECDTIFDAMKALSTTLPEERTFAADLQEAGTAGDKPLNTRIRVLPVGKADNAQPRENRSSKATPRSRKFLVVSLAALAVLLLLQLLYTSRTWLQEYPLTAKLSQQACALLNCEIIPPRDVSKIHVLSRSVYSHPNLPKLLIISSSIQNDAGFAQPYPLLEISFLNSNAEVVALRRFTPQEYMGQEKADALMESGTTEEFSVNIADPGQDAVNFQFRFL
ncbi:MAG: zinc-ribbon and DUF3426 domain-containing protein [Thiolinea sp.]